MDEKTLTDALKHTDEVLDFVRSKVANEPIPGGLLLGTSYVLLLRYAKIPKNQILSLIDDIYETGATLRTTVEILNQVVPAIPKFFLTICYIN